MEAELYEAAMNGNAGSLHELLRRDELLLDRIMTGNQTETPLHIATMLGHSDFVNQVLARKPEMARQQDSQGSTPLHLATANGDLNIVTSLFRASPEMCFVRDKYGRNPLHVAAMKGHVDVLKHLVEVRPYAAYSFVECDQTILHLCVKHNRLEALKLLIKELGNDRLINFTDGDGNTILHLAVVHKQTETVNFLINKEVSPTIKNSSGFTALVADKEEAERKRKWANSMQKTLLVVATLLATMTYQAGITPPGGLWQDDSKDNNNNNGKAQAPVPREESHEAGKSILAYKHWGDHRDFVLCNTFGFVASLSVIMILISGLPLNQSRITTWAAMLVMWVAITFTAATYAISISDSDPDSYSNAVEYATLAWVGLMALIFLWHVIPLIVKLVREIPKSISRVSTGRRPEPEGEQKKRPEP